MSDKINDGGPAFPVPRETMCDKVEAGMSYRAWVAGLAMQGIITSEYYAAPARSGGGWESIAGMSCRAADALIAELKKNS